MGAATLAAGSAGLQIAGARAEGIGKKTAAQIQSARLKQAAEAGRIQAPQVDAAFRDELNDVQQTIGALRSTQNVGFDSPTSMAIFDKAEAKSAAARKIAVSNERIKALGLEADADAALLAGRNAGAAAMLRAGPGIISSVSKAAGIGNEISSFFSKLGG